MEILAALVIIGMAAAAAQQRSRPPLPDLMRVKDNLYVINTSMPGPEFTGGNTGVFVTDAGVVLVDTKLPGYGPSIIERIKKVTDKPVTMIINTHLHADHTGSNEAFPASVDIIAHENTKTNMAKLDAFKGDKTKFLPKETFKTRLTVGSGSGRVELYYFGPGHTNGDAWVLYPSVHVLQTGDMFQWRDAPTIDRGNGGSGLEWSKTMSRAFAAIKDYDTVIPGHSPVTKPADLREYQRFITDFIAAIQAAAKAGKSVDQATASIDLTKKYRGYAKERYKPAIEAVYAELGKPTP
jgi:glyoxylase-like metal-dependent hydrolase (beta-lactamase superfamily II)